jgi:hypothetical protein
MKNLALIFIHLAAAAVLITGACSVGAAKNKFQGNWHAKNGAGKLNITDKNFIMDDSEAEDYFVKGDTLYTSYQGNQPYTSFVVQKVDEHYLKLMGPDSVAVEYSR